MYHKTDNEGISHYPSSDTSWEYISLCCKVIQQTHPEIAIERFVSQSPDNLLISPRWGLKNYEFTNLLNNQIKKIGIKQGELLNP